MNLEEGGAECSAGAGNSVEYGTEIALIIQATRKHCFTQKYRAKIAFKLIIIFQNTPAPLDLIYRSKSRQKMRKRT